MSETTKIEWATHTFNPWIGCTKVSPGCLHCYAEVSTPARVLRKGDKETWGKGAKRQRTSAATWRGPMKWHRAAGHRPALRPRVFPSLCDWLDDEVPIEWLADFLKLIYDTPNLDWLLLTKRPENFWNRISEAFECPSAMGISRWLETFERFGLPEHIRIGTSVEDQKRADERILELQAIPAKVRFLSVEPLLAPVDLAYSCFNGADSFGSMPGIHWVIVGGESGPGARPCNIEWIRSIVRQCKAARVPCFVKQLGSKPEWSHPNGGKHYSSYPFNLHHPKGGDPEEWPDDLRVREFPPRNSKLETA